MYIKVLFFLSLVLILLVAPFLHLASASFGIFGGLHLTAFLYGFVALFFLFDPEIKKLFGKSFQYLVIAFFFLTAIHFSELILETWGIFDIDKEIVELIEHVLYGMSMIFFGIAFYLRSMFVEDESQNAQQNNTDLAE